MNEEILELIDRYRDGDLSETEVNQLRDFLKEDPGLRKEFVRDRMIEAAFELESAGNLEPVRSNSSMVNFPVQKRKANGPQITTIAAAVLRNSFMICLIFALANISSII